MWLADYKVTDCLQENYNYGTQFVTINLAYILSTPVAAYIFLPVFYRLQSASVYK